MKNQSHCVTLSDFDSDTNSGPSQSGRRDLRLLKHLVRVMMGNEPGVFGGLNVSWVWLYGGSNLENVHIMAAVLFKNIQLQEYPISAASARHKIFLRNVPHLSVY